MSLTESRRRKLIFLWTYTDWGGAQLYMLTILRRALEKWDAVVAIPRTSKADLLDFYRPYDIPIDFLDCRFDAQIEVSLWGKIRRQFQRVRAEICIYRYLRKFDLRESVLHIEIAPWQSWILLSILSLRGLHVFITVNHFRPKLPKWRKIVWKARFQVLCRLPGFHLVASNHDVKESLKEWLTDNYWETVPVAYSPIDAEQISEAQERGLDIERLRKQFGLSAEDFTILTVARFIDLKGRWTLLEAAKIVLESEPNVRFVWLMPEGITDEDRLRVDGYGLSDRFVPIVSREVGIDRVSILSFFRIGDVFALPSFFEGLPLALIEAMAMGLPSISTNVYAIPEAIKPEMTGILIEPGDSQALAQAILRLRSDHALRKQLSQDGSRFVTDTFDGRIMASTYLDAYEKCFAK